MNAWLAQVVVREGAAYRLPDRASQRAAARRDRVPLPGWARRVRVGLVSLVAACVAVLCGMAGDTDTATPPTEIRFAFSKLMFMGVNENDARAAMKVYSQTIGEQNGIVVNSEPSLLDGTNGIAKALAQRQHDVFALSTPEFLAVEPLGMGGPLLCSSIRGAIEEEYLLLCRETGPLRDVGDLQGRSLIIASDIRSCLAHPWLESLCLEQGLRSAAQALGKLAFSEKTTQVILPVFFGKADACIVTRNAYETACDLNPQLKKQLRVLAKSPAVIPALSCFREGLSEQFRDKVVKAAELSSGKPAFQQMMTLFKSDGISYRPMSVLEGTRAFFAKCQQLRSAATNAVDSGSIAGAKEVPLK